MRLQNLAVHGLSDALKLALDGEAVVDKIESSPNTRWILIAVVAAVVGTIGLVVAKHFGCL